MDTDVSPAIDAPHVVLVLDAVCDCALGLRATREMAPNGSVIRAVALSSPDS